MAGRARARDRADRDPGAAVQLRVGHRRDDDANPSDGAGNRLRRHTAGLPAGGQHRGLEVHGDPEEPHRLQRQGPVQGPGPADRRIQRRRAPQPAQREPPPATTTADSGSGTTAESGSGSGSTGSQGTSGSGSGDSSGQSGTATYYTWTATVRFGIGDNVTPSTRSAWSGSARCPTRRTPSWSSWA